MATNEELLARIDALEKQNEQLVVSISAVDEARVAVEERVEKLEATNAAKLKMLAGLMGAGGVSPDGLDSMGLPKVAGP
jgi:predicted dinucleotide-utilizing enzyme